MPSPAEPDDLDMQRGLRPGSAAPPDPALSRLTAAVRRVHDTVVGVQAPPDVLARASAHLEEAAALLQEHGMGADGSPGWADLLRTAQTVTLGPQVEDVQVDRDTLHAAVTFSNFYLGGNGAVHGGAIPLLFDAVLGRLAITDRPMCRTAYLHVDFRSVTPVGRPLRIEARFEREEGRKRFLHGALYDGERLTAEVRGLFVELREGAP